MRLEKEEYVEQAYFFRVLLERMQQRAPLQELLIHVKAELLTTTNLPMAIDFMLTELRHHGLIHSAMEKLSHYFAPFQTYVVQEAEEERGRFTMEMAIRILEREAEYRGGDPDPQGLFFYQFETLCRNRLRYDPGLGAMAEDPHYDGSWRDWILNVRRQVGLVDLADLVFVRSEHFASLAKRQGRDAEGLEATLFGEKEGRIALANRRKDPLFLFAALQRHLGYPPVPLPPKHDPTSEILPQMQRRIERLETRLKMLEEEQREGAVDLSKYYKEPRSKRPPV